MGLLESGAYVGITQTCIDIKERSDGSFERVKSEVFNRKVSQLSASEKNRFGKFLNKIHVAETALGIRETRSYETWGELTTSPAYLFKNCAEDLELHIGGDLSDQLKQATDDMLALLNRSDISEEVAQEALSGIQTELGLTLRRNSGSEGARYVEGALDNFKKSPVLLRSDSLGSSTSEDDGSGYDTAPEDFIEQGQDAQSDAGGLSSLDRDMSELLAEMSDDELESDEENDSGLDLDDEQPETMISQAPPMFIPPEPPPQLAVERKPEPEADPASIVPVTVVPPRSIPGQEEQTLVQQEELRSSQLNSPQEERLEENQAITLFEQAQQVQQAREPDVQEPELHTPAEPGQTPDITEFNITPERGFIQSDLNIYREALADWPGQEAIDAVYAFDYIQGIGGPVGHIIVKDISAQEFKMLVENQQFTPDIIPRCYTEPFAVRAKLSKWLDQNRPVPEVPEVLKILKSLKSLKSLQCMKKNNLRRKYLVRIKWQGWIFLL